jgi:hypothetical protein
MKTDVFLDVILDSPNYYHILGAEIDFNQNKVAYFKGFIYMLQYWPKARSVNETYKTDCLPGYAHTNPAGACLSTCAFNQYNDDAGVCSDCDTNCKDGCLRSGNCRICQDSLCEICSDFDTCDECIENAATYMGACSC